MTFSDHDWCDEPYAANGNKAYLCRLSPDHQGDHSCPAQIEGK